MSFAAESGGGSGLSLIIMLAIAVIAIVAHWKIFTKAGQKGWTSIIPILNLVVLMKIVKRPLWWVVLMLIPIVNIVILVIVLLDLAKAFGHGVGFALGLIFLGFIFSLILGFGKSTYQLEPDPLF
ncbi:MAG: DUF5684 domain-containing protein [Actinomycetes bacterium]